MVLGGVCGEDAGHAGVKAAAEDGAESGLLKALAVGPLPGVLKVGLVLRLVVGGVEIVAAAGQTGIHDGQVLIGQGEVHHEFRLEIVEERLQLFHIVGIHLGGLDVHLVSGTVDGIHDGVAFLLAAAGNHEVSEDVGILSNLEGGNGSHTSGSNH